jgi:hypothetical protein
MFVYIHTTLILNNMPKQIHSKESLLQGFKAFIEKYKILPPMCNWPLYEGLCHIQTIQRYFESVDIFFNELGIDYDRYNHRNAIGKGRKKKPSNTANAVYKG